MLGRVAAPGRLAHLRRRAVLGGVPLLQALLAAEQVPHDLLPAGHIQLLEPGTVLHQVPGLVVLAIFADFPCVFLLGWGGLLLGAAPAAAGRAFPRGGL